MNPIMTRSNATSMRDASRNIGGEVLQAIRDIKSRRFGAKYRVVSARPNSARATKTNRQRAGD